MIKTLHAGPRCRLPWLVIIAPTAGSSASSRGQWTSKPPISLQVTSPLCVYSQCVHICRDMCVWWSHTKLSNLDRGILFVIAIIISSYMYGVSSEPPHWPKSQAARMYANGYLARMPCTAYKYVHDLHIIWCWRAHLSLINQTLPCILNSKLKVTGFWLTHSNRHVLANLAGCEIALDDFVYI